MMGGFMLPVLFYTLIDKIPHIMVLFIYGGDIYGKEY